jgi:hypothetical protein
VDAPLSLGRSGELESHWDCFLSSSLFKRFEYLLQINKMKVCCKCKIPKDLTEFSKNKNMEDGFQKYCKSCKKEIDYSNIELRKITWKAGNRNKVKKKNEKLFELRLKLGGKCNKCDEKRFHLLDFHHLNPKLKNKDLSYLLSSFGLSNPIIEKEIEKCILLCSNCHRDFHFLKNNNKITLENYLNRDVVPHSYTM